MYAIKSNKSLMTLYTSLEEAKEAQTWFKRKGHDVAIVKQEITYDG